MPVWSACRLVLLSQDGSPVFECDDGEVRLDGTVLLVSYFDDQGPVVLAGPEEGDGHFRLVARSRPRTATLSRAGDRLEGDWVEGDERGTWWIELRNG